MEHFAEAFQQLASVSAVLGGLAFTAAAALLTAGAETSHPEALDSSAKITAGTAVTSAVCFVASAVMWSFMAADVNRAVAYDESFPDHISNINWIPSLGLLAGTFLLLTSIGASGWIASRRLGYITTTAALIGGIALAAIFVWFGVTDVG